MYVDDAIKNTGEWRYIFGHRTAGDIKNVIAIRHGVDNKWYAWTTNESGQSTSVSTPDTLTIGWHYFAIRWSTSELALFINGEKVASAANPNLPSVLAPTMYIGSLAFSDYGWTNTIIDEFRISDHARTDQEIRASYNSSLPVDAWTTLKLDFNGNLNAQVGQ